MYFQVQNSNYIQVKRSSRKQVPGAYRLEVEFVDTLRADRRSALFPVSLGFPLSFFFPFWHEFCFSILGVFGHVVQWQNKKLHLAGNTTPV